MGVLTLAVMHLTSIRRFALAGVAAVTVGGGVMVASATTLGGATATNLGAESEVVAACDTDGIAIDYTNSYDPTTQRFVVDAVVVDGIAPACAGQELTVVVNSTTGTALDEASQVVAATSATVGLTTTVPSESVTGVAVLITG